MAKNAIKPGKTPFVTDFAVTSPFQGTGSKIRESLYLVLSIGLRTRRFTRPVSLRSAIVFWQRDRGHNIKRGRGND